MAMRTSTVSSTRTLHVLADVFLEARRTRFHRVESGEQVRNRVIARLVAARGRPPRRCCYSWPGLPLRLSRRRSGPSRDRQCCPRKFCASRTPAIEHNNASTTVRIRLPGMKQFSRIDWMHGILHREFGQVKRICRGQTGDPKTKSRRGSAAQRRFPHRLFTKPALRLDRDQVRMDFAVRTGQTAQRVDRPILTHRDRIHIQRAAAALEFDRTTIRVLVGWGCGK